MTTIDDNTITNHSSKGNKRKSSSDVSVPSTVKVPKVNGKKDVKVKPDKGIVIQKVKKNMVQENEPHAWRFTKEGF